MQFKPTSNNIKEYTEQVFKYGVILNEVSEFFVDADGAHFLTFCGTFDTLGKKVGEHFFYKKDNVCPIRKEVYNLEGFLVETILF